MKALTRAEISKLPKVRLPQRGDWLYARAKYHRERGMSHVPAITEAAAEWDEGRNVGNWDYEKYA